jgi:type IV pilus assembly protein PilM
MLFGNKGIIGLDIGSKHIKVVQLNEVSDGYQLERIGIATLQPELIVDGSILDSLRVVEAIKELIANSDIRVKDTVLSVSGHSSVITKRITLPQMTDEELDESIKFEAEQYIPFDIEDVDVDFQILGRRAEEGQMDVLVIAVKKDKINEYVTVVKDAGLKPVIVDVDVFALENVYETNYEIIPEENIALVTIGSSTINMNILKDGVSVFTRDSSIGGNVLTEALQKEFTISYDNAEKLKRGEAVEGISQEDVSSVLISTSEEIIAEISRSFDYFRSTASNEDVNEVIFSGGGALVKDFAPLLSERLGVGVQLIEPFRNIDIPDKFDKGYLKKIEPIVTIAVGLALRRVGDR